MRGFGFGILGLGLWSLGSGLGGVGYCLGFRAWAPACPVGPKYGSLV